MSYETPSDFAEIAKLEAEQTKIRDILFFKSVTSQGREAATTGFGRKSQSFGSHLGGESWFPTERSVTENDESGSPTGTFDRLDLNALSMIIDAAVTPIPLKWIQRIGNGKIFTLTPKAGKTLQLQPGGNIDIPANIDVPDGCAALLQYFADTGKVKCIATPAVSGGGTLPPGTAENDHLEWDSTGMAWVAQQYLEFQAGPHPTAGDIRFKNNSINISWRNFADTGDLEIKVDTNDFFDLTENNNGQVAFRIRSQHAVNPDNTMDFIVGSGAGGLLTIQGSKDIGVDIGATSVVLFEASGNINVLDNNITDVTEIHGRDDATPFKIVFDQAEDADTFISDDTATADRINVTAGGNAGWSWLWDGAKFIAGFPAGTTGELEMSNLAIVNLGAILFNDSNAQFADQATPPELNLVLSAGDIFRLTIGAVDEFDFTATSFNLRGNALEFDVAGNQDIISTGTGLDYTVPDADTHDFWVDTTLVVRLDERADGGGVMGAIAAFDTVLEFTERVTPGTNPGINTLYIYAKDDGGGVTKLYTLDSAGTETELGGGGSQTPWTSDIDADGFSLQDLDDIEFRAEVTDPAGSVAYMNYDGTQIQINFPVGQLFKVRQNNVDVIQLSGTLLRPSTDEAVSIGNGGARFLEGHFVEVSFKNNGTSVPAAGVHQITADTNGIYIGADDLTDEIMFYLAGQQHMQFRDGAMEFSQEGHEISWSGSSLSFGTLNTTDSLDFFTGLSRAFQTVEMQNLVIDINTPSTSETEPMELRFIFRHSNPGGLSNPDFGRIKFLGENSASAIHEFALITGGQIDDQSGSEAGFIQLGAYSDGIARAAIAIEGDLTANIKLGFYDKGLGSTVAKQTVTGSRGGNAALASLLTALDALGLITDSST